VATMGLPQRADLWGAGGRCTLREELSCWPGNCRGLIKSRTCCKSPLDQAVATGCSEPGTEVKDADISPLLSSPLLSSPIAKQTQIVSLSSKQALPVANMDFCLVALSS